eukprot:6459164-Amphidinium_carterae.1
MSLSRELHDIGMHISPTELRYAVKQQWSSGTTVLGAGADFWCRCFKCSPETFIQTTCGYRWGSAPDAMIACKLLKINLLIVSGNDILVRQRARSEHWVVLHLRDRHYSVVSRDTISASYLQGRSQYWVADKNGKFVNIAHYSQFKCILPSRAAKS